MESNTWHKVAVIVAGGKGERMGGGLPKQFMEIKGVPILMHTINIFHKYDPTIEIRLVLPKEQVEMWQSLCKKFGFSTKHTIFNGGSTRFHSVKNGLKGVKMNSLVAIHDGVRPLVSIQTLNRCYNEAINFPAVVPVISVNETIRILDGDESKTVPRSKYRLVQTPQVFQSGVLLTAYEQEFSEKFTDDASVVESARQKIQLVEGNRENIKITHPVDLILAEALLSQ